MTSKLPHMTKLQVVAISALVLNIFQMLLCPLIAKMIQLFEVSQIAYDRVKAGEWPIITNLYHHYAPILVIALPLAFIMTSLLLFRLNVNSAIKLTSSVIMTGYFILFLAVVFFATAYPILQMQSAVPAGIRLEKSDLQSYIPPNGYVPDSASAISIALAVCMPIYGDEMIKREMPFTAKLVNGVWHVEGYLPLNMEGGVAEVSISQKDGKVLSVTHGK
jgi:hypothetical protein